MEFTLLGIRLLLAVVLAAAAVGKLCNLVAFRRSLVDLGVPKPLVTPAAAALVPAGELVAAGLLVPAGLTRWGVMLSLALLVIFTVVVVIALGRGRTPDCRCFGQAEPAPIGAMTLMRNAVLAACAVLLLAAGTGPGLGTAYDMWVTGGPVQRRGWSLDLGAVAVLGVLGWLAARQYERNTVLAARVAVLERERGPAASSSPESGLAIGIPAPTFDLPLLVGGRATVDSLTDGDVPVLFVFSRTHCPACAELWPDIGRWQQALKKTLKVIVIATGEAAAIELKLIGTGVRDVVLAEDTSLDEAYRVPGLPSAVVVAPDGTIDSETVMGPHAVRQLVRQHAGV